MARPLIIDSFAVGGRPARMRKMLVADLLCGAGGSSTGCQRALAELGLEMELVAVNHWPTAIATHTLNHPTARHYVQDIATVRPHLLVPEGYLDLLMASPTCTHHSVARGGKPTSDQQRSDPWHIITWLTELRVKRLIIENVWEFCFPPETAVLSKRGMVPIGSLKVGDEVWTHNARWKPVTAISRRTSPTVRVAGYGNSIIETTPNHEFYAREIAPKITVSGKRGRHERRLLEPTWVRADRLADIDERSTYTRQNSGWCWATPAELPRYWRRMPNALGVDTDAPAFFYMLGRWLGDGWIKKRKEGRQNLVRICANRPEADELSRRLADTGLVWRRYPHTASVDVFDLEAAKSKLLIAWLRLNFGEYADRKTLPAWVYGASEEQRQALIRGYHDADGHEGAQGVTSSVSVSRCLAVGMKLLLQSLGHAASISRIEARRAPAVGGEGTMDCREAFHVSWRREVEWEKAERSELHIWGRVRSAEPCRDETEVVDITVADDHSFIADGQVVHNCGWGPIDHRTGKPVASRKGEYFRAWIDTIKRLGFQPEWRKLNAADYGDATTRSRFILMARSDRKRLVWPVATHHRRGGTVDLFSGAKVWRPAREIIDWGIKGRSIFERKKPLAPKTLARIYAGARKHGWPEPFLVVLRNHMTAQGMDMPLPAITAGGTHIALAQPVIVNMKGRSTASASDVPLPTQTAHAPHLFTAEPIVLSTAHGVGGGEIDPHTRRTRSVEDPLGAVHAGGGNFGVVEPFVLSQASGGAPRGVGEPIPTQTTGGNGAAHALISPYYGSGSGDTCTEADAPLPTVTSKGRFGMVVPVTQTNGGAAARDVADPVPTMPTAKGGEFAIVMPITHHDASDRVRDPAADPLPTVTGANRGELAFIAAQFGEREGQAPRTHDIEDPAPTLCATGRVNLVQGTERYDILFRMLEPHELAAAMGFDTPDARYEFTGTKTEQIKQIGNAVSVAKMKACVAAIMADAAPARSDAPDSLHLIAAE